MRNASRDLALSLHCWVRREFPTHNRSKEESKVNQIPLNVGEKGWNITLNG